VNSGCQKKPVAVQWETVPADEILGLTAVNPSRKSTILLLFQEKQQDGETGKQ
jgi:hypothetical protein